MSSQGAWDRVRWMGSSTGWYAHGGCLAVKGPRLGLGGPYFVLAAWTGLENTTLSLQGVHCCQGRLLGHWVGVWQPKSYYCTLINAFGFSFGVEAWTEKGLYFRYRSLQYVIFTSCNVVVLRHIIIILYCSIGWYVKDGLVHHSCQQWLIAKWLGVGVTVRARAREWNYNVFFLFLFLFLCHHKFLKLNVLFNLRCIRIPVYRFALIN